jgi:hypothetical protein
MHVPIATAISVAVQAAKVAPFAAGIEANVRKKGRRPLFSK